MRIRNNKVNVFLSDDEKFILKRDSSRLNLSQSEYIRNLIIGYEIKVPKVKKEPKPKKEEYVIENIAKALEENIECLIKVKNKFHYLGYFEDERAIGTKIEYLKLQNSTLKKYMPIEFIIYLYCVILTNFEHTIIVRIHHQYHLDLLDQTFLHYIPSVGIYFENL